MPNEAFSYEEDEASVYPDRILYLNAVRDPDSRINGAVFVVTPDELTTRDGREWIYDRVVVTNDLRGIRIEGGEAMMYVGKPEHQVAAAADPHLAAIRHSFVRLLDSVLEALPPSVRQDFLRSTDLVPEPLVIDDALDPNRPNPWEAAGFSFRPKTPPEGH